MSNKIKRSSFNTDIKTQGDECTAGQSLLSKVLEMQDLLEENQHALTALEIEKADKQQEIDKLDKLLKGKCEAEGKLYFLFTFINHKY